MKNAFEFKTLAEFLEYFKDEAACVAHFTASRFRDGEYFARIAAMTRVYFSAGTGKRYQCAKCKTGLHHPHQNPFLARSKLAASQVVNIAVYLLLNSSKGISSVQLSKHVGVTQKTAWFMDHRLRSA